MFRFRFSLNTTMKSSCSQFSNNNSFYRKFLLHFILTWTIFGVAVDHMVVAVNKNAALKGDGITKKHTAAVCTFTIYILLTSITQAFIFEEIDLILD